MARKPTSLPKPARDKRIPEHINDENVRVLTRNFHLDRPFETGAIVIVSDTEIPELNSAQDILVVDSHLAKLLETSGVTIASVALPSDAE